MKHKKGGKHMQKGLDEKADIEKLVLNLGKLSKQSLMIIQSGVMLLLARDQEEQQKQDQSSNSEF